MKQEAQPSSMHNFSTNSHLGTQYPYFDLCKKFLMRFNVGP